MANAARLYFHADLTRARLRDIAFHQFKIGARFADLCRFHFLSHESSRCSSLTRAQSQSFERVRRQSAGHTQPVAALVECNSSLCFRTDNSVDLSAIITLPREP